MCITFLPIPNMRIAICASVGAIPSAPRPTNTHQNKFYDLMGIRLKTQNSLTTSQGNFNLHHDLRLAPRIALAIILKLLLRIILWERTKYLRADGVKSLVKPLNIPYRGDIRIFHVPQRCTRYKITECHQRIFPACEKRLRNTTQRVRSCWKSIFGTAYFCFCSRPRGTCVLCESMFSKTNAFHSDGGSF